MKNALIFGDSLVSGIQIQGYECEVHSRPGESTYGLLNSFPDLEHYLKNFTYDLVVIIVGTNDMASDALPTFAIQNLIKMHSLCKQYGVLSIATTIMHNGFNHLYEMICLDLKIPICNFLEEEMDASFLKDDGVHLNADGSAEFGFSITKAMEYFLVLHGLKSIFGVNEESIIDLIQDYY